MKMLAEDEGFTLIELMVVVLIIGVLVAIAVPVFNSARSNSERKSCFANMRTVEGAYQTWHGDNLSLAVPVAGPTDWNSVMGVLVPNYVKNEPVCPAQRTIDYTATFNAQGTVVTVACSYAPGGTVVPHIR